ncbi:hypothetical protein AOC36_04065 [Erysipelothrix larvae]|uniref:PASTA domain-containing protein n=1 Tax=Erysipelothrix larvae TaxID=1514105 RepID=A0A0X8GZ90_9FIRM|nr:penicillin-binding protein [Erysipelothrix larvae]AMC93175.1 hypothetical protein AOC36_04065 [Erysipelothrix larvae]
MKRRANIRILLSFLVVTIVFALVSANVFVVSILGWHINSSTSIRDKVEGMYVVEEDIIAKRGNIIDRNGNILAQDVTAYTLYANIDPDRFSANGDAAHVVDKEAAATIIASVIDSEYNDVLAILNSEGSKEVQFGTKGKYLSLSQKQKLEASDISGLGFYEIVQRSYLSDTLATTLIGRSIFDEESGEQNGIMGIESYYNDILTGVNGSVVFRQDSDNYRFETFENLSRDAINGMDVVLTIDRGIQEELEIALQTLLTSDLVHASEAWGAVMNIKTGEILAFADRPAFDATDPETTYLNRGTQYQYEPGSTMKTFTIASAIDNGAVTPTSTFDSSPFYIGLDANGKAIRVTSGQKNIGVVNNADYEQYGTITHYLGYQKSSNVGIADILVNHLNPEELKNDLLELGFFDNVTSDRIPDETGYLVWDGPREKINNGFGQGSTVTMLQILQGYSAIFGDGTVVKPYFVKQIIDTANNTIEYEAQKQTLNKVYKESTVQTVRDLMYENVESVDLTRFKMDEVSVMAKSGTAQLVIDGAYSRSQYIFSAALGFPYEDPEYMMYFAYQTGNHATRNSANIMKNVVRKVVSTYPISSGETDYVPEGESFTMTNLINLPVTLAKDRLAENKITPIIFGDGSTVINQYPKDGQSYMGSDKVLLFTSTSNIIMPDMTGWTMKEVRAFSDTVSLTLKASGSGYVKSQSIPQGTVVETGGVLEITLE